MSNFVSTAFLIKFNVGHRTSGSNSAQAHTLINESFSMFFKNKDNFLEMIVNYSFKARKCYSWTKKQNHASNVKFVKN